MSKLAGEYDLLVQGPSRPFGPWRCHEIMQHDKDMVTVTFKISSDENPVAPRKRMSESASVRSFATAQEANEAALEESRSMIAAGFQRRKNAQFIPESEQERLNKFIEQSKSGEPKKEKKEKKPAKPKAKKEKKPKAEAQPMDESKGEEAGETKADAAPADKPAAKPKARNKRKKPQEEDKSEEEAKPAAEESKKEGDAEAGEAAKEEEKPAGDKPAAEGEAAPLKKRQRSVPKKYQDAEAASA
jgi:hypothetical protein